MNRAIRNLSLMGWLIILCGLLFVSQYTEYGYINTARWAFVPTFGKKAVLIMCTTLSAGIFFVLWSFYLLFCRSKFSRRGEFGPAVDRPDYVICANCGEVFNGLALVANLCPKCSGQLENLEGFYDRHPDLKRRDFPPHRVTASETSLSHMLVAVLLMVVASIGSSLLLAWMIIRRGFLAGN